MVYWLVLTSHEKVILRIIYGKEEDEYDEVRKKRNYICK